MWSSASPYLGHLRCLVERLLVQTPFLQWLYEFTLRVTDRDHFPTVIHGMRLQPYFFRGIAAHTAFLNSIDSTQGGAKDVSSLLSAKVPFPSKAASSSLV